MRFLVCSNIDGFHAVLSIRHSRMKSWHNGLPSRILAASLFQTPAKVTAPWRCGTELIGELRYSKPQLTCIRLAFSTICFGVV